MTNRTGSGESSSCDPGVVLPFTGRFVDVPRMFSQTWTCHRPSVNRNQVDGTADSEEQDASLTGTSWSRRGLMLHMSVDFYF